MRRLRWLTPWLAIAALVSWCTGSIPIAFVGCCFLGLAVVIERRAI